AVPAESCHSCKLADCEAAPCTTRPLLVVAPVERIVAALLSTVVGVLTRSFSTVPNALALTPIFADKNVSSVFSVSAALRYRLVSREDPNAIPAAAVVLSALLDNHRVCVSAAPTAIP